MFAPAYAQGLIDRKVAVLHEPAGLDRLVVDKAFERPPVDTAVKRPYVQK